MNNETDVSIKFKNYVTGEKKLEKYAQTLSLINSVMSGFNTNTSKSLEKSATDTKEIAKDVSTMKNITKLAFNYSTIREFSRMLNRTVTEMARLIDKSTDYLENINLYQVAFDGNYKSADKFINKMTEMYGLDESWLTRTVGIFKQLSNAMGVSVETGEKLSTLLTQMSLDISSLYNVDMERASSVLQSAMAGQTKPIRGLTGGDITQATLQTTLDTLGIERAVNELSFAEKRLLIVISLTQQLNESIGDMGRTIESPANQMRVLNSQWERLSRAVGNVFMPILAEVLPYLNAIMMILTEIINMVATLFGYKQEDFDYFTGTTDSVIDLEESLNGASASAEKLKHGLRGFDKLNVITTPQSTSSGIGGIDSDILDAFNKSYEDYQNMLDNVEMKATRIRDSVMEWLGFTKKIDKETGKVTWEFEKITGGTILGALAVGGTIFTGISKILGMFQKMGLIKMPFLDKLSNVGKFVGKLTLFISGLIINADAIEGLINDGATWSNVLKALGGTAMTATGVFLLTKSVTLTLLVSSIMLVADAGLAIKDLWEEMTPLIEENGGAWETWKKGAKIAIDEIGKGLGSLKENIDKKIDEFGRSLLRNEDDWGTWKEEIGILWDIFTFDFKGMTDTLTENFGRLKKEIDKNGGAWESWKQGINLIWTDTKNWFIEKWNESSFGKLNKAIEENGGYWKSWKQGVGVIWNDAKTWFEEKWNESSFSKLGKAIEENGGAWESWKQGVGVILDELGLSKYFTKEYWTEKFSNIQKGWEDVKNWFRDNFKLPELKMPSFPKIGLNVSYDSNVGAIKTAVYSALGLEGWPRLNFYTYANGGLPPVGQLFVANERGPELIGNIGGQSFVANQNQMMDLLDRKIGNAQSNQPQVFNIYLDEDHKLGTYTLEQLQEMSKTNGKPLFG